MNMFVFNNLELILIVKKGFWNSVELYIGFFFKICDVYRLGSVFGRKRYVYVCFLCCGIDLCNLNCMLFCYMFDLKKKYIIFIYNFFFYLRYNVNIFKLK